MYQTGRGKVKDYRALFAKDLVILSRLWSILPDTAYFLFHWIVQNQPKDILEFGSGVSTVVMAKAAAGYSGKLYSLEHEQKWLERSEEMCRVCGASHYEIIYAPLVESHFDGVEKFVIYDPARIPAKGFEFVFIDGPPGFLPEHPGRRGTLYSCWPYLAHQATIVLDDAEREGEQEAVREWMGVFGERLAVRAWELKRPVAQMEAKL
jgi:predicted O-methyltransferase YrrM